MLRRLSTMLCLVYVAAPAMAGELRLNPPTATLHGRDGRQQFAVTENGLQPVDRTREASYTSSNSAVASVNAAGIVAAKGNGQATITASFKGQSTTAVVKVANGADALPVTFEHDIVPILTRFGCNQ